MLFLKASLLVTKYNGQTIWNKTKMSLVFTANSKPEAATAGYVGQEMQLLFHYFLNYSFLFVLQNCPIFGSRFKYLIIYIHIYIYTYIYIYIYELRWPTQYFPHDCTIVKPKKTNYFFPPLNSALFYNLPLIQDTHLRQTPKMVFGAEIFKYSL